MKQLIFATGNRNKLKEVRELLDGEYEVLGLEDIGCTEEIPETQPTIEGNAIQKAEYVKQHYQLDCFSEDTGLEIEALDGAPGVYSARYAGPDRDPEANIQKVLRELDGQSNRKARFKTVVALVADGKIYTFEGIVNGTIRAEKSTGNEGFGYDPIFQPDGYAVTFAQMGADEKNKISHRGRAVRQLISFLKEGEDHR
jgi:XTP/dITP diphosphohydrolase